MSLFPTANSVLPPFLNMGQTPSGGDGDDDDYRLVGRLLNRLDSRILALIRVEPGGAAAGQETNGSMIIIKRLSHYASLIRNWMRSVPTCSASRMYDSTSMQSTLLLF